MCRRIRPLGHGYCCQSKGLHRVIRVVWVMSAVCLVSGGIRKDPFSVDGVGMNVSQPP